MSAETDDAEVDARDCDFSEPEDEETFRAQHYEMDRQMEENSRPFVSRHISQCCYNIAKSIDVLENSILKKPYYSFLLSMKKGLSKKKELCDPISKQVYESEKKRLDKLLERQQAEKQVITVSEK